MSQLESRLPPLSVCSALRPPALHTTLHAFPYSKSPWHLLSKAQYYSTLNKFLLGASDMNQQLRKRAVLAEDLSLVPNTYYLVSQNSLELQRF